MCAYYWNLTATWTCPSCAEVNEDAELQTHFGDGYCTMRYRLGEPVPHLGDMTVTLGPTGPDDFIGDCESCGTYFDFGATIERGVVVAVWPVASYINGKPVELVQP
jgi:hypothetical protein